MSERLFAAFYDLLNSGVEGRLAKYRERTAGRTWGNVLEVGADTGANLPFYGPDVRLTAVEPNLHMAGRLRRRASRAGRALHLVRTVGEQLPFPDKSFNCVVATLALCMVRDSHLVVGEARRVLRPGGSFFFFEHVVSQRPRGRRWQERLNPAWRFVTTGCNLNRDTAGVIQAAGFATVEVQRFDLSVGLPVTIPNVVGVARV